MKKIVLLAVFISTVVLGNNMQIPDIVATSFTEQFPEALDAKWKMEFNMYKVDFNQNDKPMTAFFNLEGKCMETAAYISEDQLPKKALKEIDWYYKNGMITSSRKAKDLKSTDFYRVTVKTGEAFYFLKVDAEGDIIDTSVRYLSQNTKNK